MGSIAKSGNWIRNNVWLLIILAIASILRLYRIDYQSIWLDEIHTLIETDPSLSFSELFQSLKNIDPHPPLYFVIVKIGFKIFGYTPLTMRIITAIIGIAGITAIYRLGKELYNKQTGLYAAAIISVSYFHIHYSQDARPYALLFLTTVLSFTYLVKFIKQPTYTKALLYAIFTGLMVYSHFFSLFALLAQVFILLYYVFYPKNVTKATFFKQCILAGLTIAILYIPCYPLLFAASGRTSIWIEKPTLTDYINIYKDFLGFSKTLIYLFLCLIIYYISLPFIKKGKLLEDHSEKYKLSLLILLPWVVITVLIPAIRSYVSLPMIVNRYFINVYPAIILIAAIAISQISSKYIRYGLFSIILIVCANNLVRQKDYYRKITKTQFREVTNFIKAKNDLKAPVITTIDWHYRYLFKDIPGQGIVSSTPDDYVAKMIAGTERVKPFWLTDAHGTKFRMRPESSKFLKDNFNLVEKTSLLDAWARLYVPKFIDVNKKKEQFNIYNKKPIKVVDLERFSPISSKNGTGLEFYNTSTTASQKISMAKGNYVLLFRGISYPAVAIDNESAHFTIKINGLISGDFYLGEKGDITPDISLNLPDDSEIVIEVMFDNDVMKNNVDRNGTITGIEIFQIQ